MRPDDIAGFNDDPQSLNLYSYALNNPHGYKDATANLAILFVIPLRNEVESAYFADLNYAPHGAMSFIAYGNGLKEDRFYNSRLQPDRYTLSDNRILNFSLYDELDRLKKALRKVSGSITAEWVHSYSYDRFGNLTGNGAGLSLTVDQATNRITNAGFSYDGAGNLVSDWTQSKTSSLSSEAVLPLLAFN